MKSSSLILLLATSYLHSSTALPTVSSPLSPSPLVVYPSSSKKNHRSSSLLLEDAVALQEEPSSQKVRGGAVVPTQQQQQNALVADLLHRLKIGFYFGLWYALNIIYNIINKKILNICPAPLTIGSIQLGIGAAYITLLWLTKLRPMPVLTDAGRQALRQIGLWHATGQLASMVSLGAGAISFTHIVKALEPFFSAVVSAVVFGKRMRPTVYATLIPVVGGVGYACLKERAFSWLAFWTAMLSNLAFALRAVLSKTAMTGEPTRIGTNLTAANVFGLVTLSSFVVSIPMALIGEGKSLGSIWEKTVELQPNSMELIKSILISGLFHYLNNEVMFLALGQVHPITLAVGNTMKRVFIMIASVIAFRNHISLQAGIGSAVGMSGVLLYSLTKQYYEKLDADKAEQTNNKKKR